MPYNPNRYSGQKRQAQDVSQLMRDINALEGVKADETLATTLTPQYGIIIGAGGALTEPRYCDVDSSGNIYVADASRRKVVKYTAAGNFVAEWGTLGTNPGEFQDLVGLSVDPSNNVWVTDTDRDVVIKFNSSGTYQSEFTVTALGGSIDTPADGYVYLSYGTGVKKYSTAGVLQTTYSDPTKIGVVFDVAVTDGGIIYVAQSVLGVGCPVKIDPSGPTYTVIGTLGTGAGQFQKAQGITVGASGNIYTSDSTRDKVIIYDSTLTYVTEFGTSGSSPGQFTTPYGLCLNIDGSILVPDSTRARVLRFAYATASDVLLAGSVVMSVGANGYLYGLNIQAGTPGTIVRKIDTTPAVVAAFTARVIAGWNIAGMAADSSGNVYVGRNNNAYDYGKVEKYNSGGTFQSEWNTIGVPTNSRYITDMVVDGSGNVLVLTYNYILRYNSSGALLSYYTVPAQAGAYASGLSTYPGFVYLFFFSPTLGSITKLTILLSDLSGATAQYTTFPASMRSMDRDSNDLLYGLSGSVLYEMSVGTSIVALRHWTINNPIGGITLSGFYRIRHLSGYAFVNVTSPANSYYGIVRSSPTSANGFLSEMPDGVSSTISGPTDVAVDSTHLHITDTGNNRVARYTKADGQYVSQFGSAGSGNGQFSAPKGIAKDSGGNIWVVDSGNNRVQKFNSSGTYQSQFGSAGSGNGQFNNPDRIFIDALDNIYITDKGNHRVQVFNSSGTYQRKFGTSGSANGNLSSPVGVAKNPSTGHVYVTNTANHRMEVFYEFDANTAKYVSRWGSNGSSTTSRQFSSPEGVDVDNSGHMWIADTGNNRIARIAAHGKLSTFYGTAGAGDGNFSSPSGLSLYQNELYVVDRGNARVHKFLIGESSQLDIGAQTQFTYYITPSGERSMGIPDRGVHVPDIGALAFPPSADELGDSVGVNVSATKYMTDMRTAVERLAASGVFTDGADGVPFDWSAGTSNLYKRALSGRHDMYGVPEADGTAKRTWTRGALRKSTPVDLDIGEVYETVRKLKEATWGAVP